MPLLGATAALLAALIALGVPATPARAAASPCARASALLAARYYAQAEQEYERLLGVAPCATPRLAIRARADAASHAAASTEPKQQLAQALRLQNAGFEEDARALVKAVVTHSSTSVPSSLRAVNQRIGWWRRLLGTYGPALRLGLELLAAAVGLFVALLLVFTASNALLQRFLPAGQIEGFSGSGDATLTAVLTSSLNAVLGRMRDEGAIRSVDSQSGTEPKFELPAAVAEAVPQANFLAGLVQMLDGLLYRNLEIVSGTVHPVHEHRGAGLTLVVSARRGRVIEQITIWEQDFMLKEAGERTAEVAVRYERLTLPAAIWLAYKRSERLSHGLGNRFLHLFKARELPPLNTKDWRSYALFALGELVPDAAKQRQLYEQALDIDPGNLGARLNLAALLLQRPAEDVALSQQAKREISNRSREGWSGRVARARMHLDEIVKEASKEKEAIWYRAAYMRVVCDIYAKDGVGGGEKLKQLLKEIEDNGASKRLHALVEALKQPIAVLEKTVELIETGKVEKRPDYGEQWLTATAEYNLACFWARYAEHTNNQRQKAIHTGKAVELLRRASERGEQPLADARVDPAFDAIRATAGFKTLTEAAQTQAAEPPPPTRYAVTLDPGPQLLALAGAPGPPAAR